MLAVFQTCFLTGCDSCRDCIVAVKDIEISQEDGSNCCLYFGDFNKFVYRPIYTIPCPDTLRIKKEALQNKGIMGQTFVNGQLIVNGTVFHALPICRAEQRLSTAFETPLEKYCCQLLKKQKRPLRQEHRHELWQAHLVPVYADVSVNQFYGKLRLVFLDEFVH